MAQTRRAGILCICLAALLIFTYSYSRSGPPAWELAAAKTSAPHTLPDAGAAGLLDSAVLQQQPEPDPVAEDPNPAARPLVPEAKPVQVPEPVSERTLEQQAPVPPVDDNLLLEGRFAIDAKDGALAFEWSLSTIRARFEAESIAMRLRLISGEKDFYAVRLDGGHPVGVAVDGEDTLWPLFKGLKPGPHEISVTKRTEPTVATAEFAGFDLGKGGKLLEAPLPKPHRIEIIGDSIATGFGNECDHHKQRFTSETEDADMSFGAVTGRRLDAETRIIAWSGKGLFRNSNLNEKDAMPVLWTRTLPASAPEKTWDFSQWQPHVVVINLLTNDYNPPPPQPAEVRTAYTGFLKQIRETYPQAAIVVTIGPMLSDDYPAEYPGMLKRARAVVEDVVDNGGFENVTLLEFPHQHSLGLGLGCQSHPSLEVHAVMGELLTAAIEEVTGWEGKASDGEGDDDVAAAAATGTAADDEDGPDAKHKSITSKAAGKRRAAASGDEAAADAEKVAADNEDTAAGAEEP